MALHYTSIRLEVPGANFLSISNVKLLTIFFVKAVLVSCHGRIVFAKTPHNLLTLDTFVQKDFLAHPLLVLPTCAPIQAV